MKNLLKHKTSTLIMLLLIIVILQACNKNESNENMVASDSIFFHDSIYYSFNIDNELFVPFGDDHCIWRTNHEFIFENEFAYLEDDLNLNFVYLSSVLGTHIYVKDGFDIPYNPAIDDVNGIIIWDYINTNAVYIYDKNVLSDITTYFNGIHGKIKTQDKNSDIDIFAISKKYGGLFRLTGDYRGLFYNDSSISFGITGVELPKNIEKTIISYIR